MSDNRKYYVLCADNCKFEGMTKEQILTAIEQAMSTGEIKDIDTGFVTKIKERNKNVALSFWVGSSAEYNALETKAENCFYILTDDTTGADIAAAIEEIKTSVNALEKHSRWQTLADVTTTENVNSVTIEIAEDLRHYNEFHVVVDNGENDSFLANVFLVTQNTTEKISQFSGSRGLCGVAVICDLGNEQCFFGLPSSPDYVNETNSPNGVILNEAVNGVMFTAFSWGSTGTIIEEGTRFKVIAR